MFPVERTDHMLFVIFSTNKSVQETKDELFSRMVPFKTLKGKYKGQEEVSYIAPFDAMRNNVDLVQDQESVLVLGEFDGEKRQAYLHYNDQKQTGNRVEDIGFFIAVPSEEALQQDAYTFDPSTGEFYICKKAV